MVIDISPDGTTQAMHRDEFPLSFLGDREIERATEIKFNITTQMWAICLPTADIDRVNDDGSACLTEWYPYGNSAGFRTYEAARKVEVEWLDACRAKDMHPRSASGLGLLATIRTARGE